jgi:hypothetical protein
MKKTSPVLLTFLLLTSALSLAQQVDHNYFFNGSFAEIGSGPALAEIRGCGAAPGAFAAEAINTSVGSCANGATANVFAFNAGGGVQYPNTVGVVGKSYTINVFFKFNTIGGWSRIIDFTNGIQDAGIYLLGNCLNFYPNGNVGPACPFVAGKHYLMSFVRDSVTKIISVYVDGVVYASYNDAAGTYVPTSTNLPINFFFDDAAVGCEVKAGTIKYLSVSNAPLTATGVDSVWKNICNIALPVRLGKLDGVIRTKTAELQWQTFGESNSAHFLVEHSNDGNAFTEIGKIAAAGNSTQKRSYSYVHKDVVGGIHYYRLKMVDKDGSFSYSNVVKLSSNGTVAFDVFPNPARHSISISGLRNAVNEVTITTTDSRVVMKTQVNGQSATINISHLPKGHYFLNYFDGSRKYSRLWVKE